MKGKPILIIASLVLAFAIVRFINRYAHWRREALKRLQTNSRVLDTVLGAVEYSRKGQGPAVLFVHGTPGGYDQGLAVANLLAKDDFTCIAVSRPGYLRTPLHADSPEAQADLYAALLDQLGIQKAALIAVSGGGPSALQFALHHPERCSGLILLAALSKRYSEKEVLETMPRMQRFIKSQLERLLFFNNPALFLAEALLLWQPFPIPMEFYEAMEMHQLRDPGYKNDMQQFERIDEYPLERIPVPTLVLHGNRDSNVPLTHSQLVASKVPRSRLLIDEGGNHFFYVIHKEKIIPMILEFLYSIAPDESKRKDELYK